MVDSALFSYLGVTTHIQITMGTSTHFIGQPLYTQVIITWQVKNSSNQPGTGWRALYQTLYSLDSSDSNALCRHQAIWFIAWDNHLITRRHSQIGTHRYYLQDKPQHSCRCQQASSRKYIWSHLQGFVCPLQEWTYIGQQKPSASKMDG